MALDAEIRIPDTTLQDNDFKDGEILRGSDVNKIVSVLKAGVNENYKDLKESDTLSNEHILDEVRHITEQERNRWNNTYTKEELYTKEEVYNKSEVYNKNETYPKENLYTKEETYSKNDVYTKDNVYTKGEVDKHINDKISEIGSADMQKAVYDTNNNGTVDDSEKLGGQLPSYYASNSELNSLQETVSQSSVFFGDGEDTSLAPINADLLENHNASYFATSEELDTKANKSDVLSLEEIQASTDLSGKIASASSVRTLENNRDNWKLLTTVLGANVVEAFESLFQSAVNRTMVTLQTSTGAEGGGIMFKHEASYLSYGIIFNRAIGAKIIKRDTDGRWYYRDIL